MAIHLCHCCKGKWCSGDMILAKKKRENLLQTVRKCR